MDTNTQPGAIELIRLTCFTQSVSVRLRSTAPTHEGNGVRYYAADAVITSDFVNGTVPLGFDSDDLTDWGLLLNAAAEAERDGALDDPFKADWPRAGRTAYLRFIAHDPYLVEVHDGPSTRIVVSVPLDMGEEWIAESRERLTAARAALGE
ncbi:hypothetical protein GCM10018781_02170 [Kitasatospora indigofera]|uniref:Uncharacterized protein n=1 Tax=Kitasatospora indigofera TaxID=67307 RepID=A0A919FAT7_9ACTN|nr:DUF5959 family protein [Kitasatospora indigofera]GHH59265.1 hypothetical protein GCM10018781_02170 [Kitasatospora indigofera]